MFAFNEGVDAWVLAPVARGWTAITPETLRVHLGMHGRWARLHARERRPRSPTVVLVSGDSKTAAVRAALDARVSVSGQYEALESSRPRLVAVNLMEVLAPPPNQLALPGNEF